MSDYTAVANTGNAITELLKDALVPELLNSPDQVGLCSPEDYGDYAVGIWLYDIKEDQNVQMHEMINDGYRSQRYPSAYLALYYMITLYLRSDLKYRAMQEQQMIGRIVQALKDQAVLDADSFVPAPEGARDGIRLKMQDMSIEEKLRIWTVPNCAYKTSLFYTASPVEVRSSRMKTVSRVRDIEYRFG